MMQICVWDSLCLKLAAAAPVTRCTDVPVWIENKNWVAGCWVPISTNSIYWEPNFSDSSDQKWELPTSTKEGIGQGSYYFWSELTKLVLSLN